MNVDLGWPAGTAGNPNPSELQRAGIRKVRFVSRGPAIEPRIAEYDAAGILTLGVVTAESAGYVCGARIIQIGNEPNLPGTGDSLAPSGSNPDLSFAARLQLFRNTYPDHLLIAGGLANWGTLTDRLAYITAVKQAGGLVGYSAIAVHYPPVAPQITALAKAAGLPVYVTEWRADSTALAEYVHGLRAAALGIFGFCWDEAMVPNFGFTDAMKRLYGGLA